ncbi:MAG: hypothetical protein MPJ78_06605 [Hyphomicrobiaceae bacterium]|nr:hypothetical protein [Hyphomicrobiaceae bacterium]
MSFALEYRKKLQRRQLELRRARKENEGFVSLPVEEVTDTTRNRSRVLLALVIAGGVLATFNSGGLVQYSYELAENPAGQKLIEATERWHEMMRETPAGDVMDHIRGSVATVRETSWDDLAASFFAASPPVYRETTPEGPVAPAGGSPLRAPSEQDALEPDRPDGPVMRASVSPAPVR